MASWLTRLLDKATPWDRGGERKRREEEERRSRPSSSGSTLSVTTAQPKQNISVPSQPKMPKTADMSTTLSDSLFVKPKSTLDSIKSQKPVEAPKPGMVVKPTTPTQRISNVTTAPDAGIRVGNEVVRRTPGMTANQLERPKQSFGNRIRDVFDTNTEADQYRRYQGNISKGENKDIIMRGSGNLATKIAGGSKDFIVEGAKSVGRGTKMITANPVESARGVLAQVTGNKAAEEAANYRQNVNMFGKEAADRMARGEKLSGWDLVRPVTDAISVIPAVGGARIAARGAKEALASRAIQPLFKGAVTGFDEALVGLRDLRNFIRRPKAVKEAAELEKDLLESGTIGNVDDVLSAEAIDDILRKTDIPVTQVSDIPVTQVREEVPINVRRTTPEGPLIRELAGDAPTPTRVPSPTDVIEQRAARRFAQQDWGIPDPRIEGTLPLTRGDITDARATLDDLVNTNRISTDDYVVLNKQLDEVEGNVPKGRSIEVRDENTIPVRTDETVVPVNTPETPGIVRPTVQRAPTQEVSEAVAREAVPTAPVEIPSATTTPTMPTTSTSDGDLNKVFEDVLAGLKENQKAYGVEKKMKASEFKRRKANYDRLYDEARASGKSSQESEAIARSALGGAYARNTVGNVEISQANRDMLFDKVSKGKDNLNTKKAFEHLFDPNRTEPLRDWERARVRRFLNETVGEDAAQAIEEALITAEQTGDRSAFGKVADFMTSAIAAGDVSAAGRQGLSGWINHPRMSKGAWDDALKALRNPEEEQRFISKLINDPDTAFIQENMGGKYLTLSDVADEARGAKSTNKAIAWYVDPSNRHYNVYLDSLRHQQKKAILERYGGQEGFLKAAQAANPENPEKWMKAWNSVIDRQSGRGNLGGTGSPTAGDIQVLFSARNLASKFQKLTAPAQLGLLRTNPDAYLYQLKETGAQAAAIGATLAALGASGLVDIENGKIKVGNTRVDITGGFSTIFKAANDLYKSVTGQNEGGFARSGGEVVTDFLRNQLSPILGTAGKLLDVDWSEGKDKYGNDVDAGWYLKNAPLPAVVQTGIDSVSEGQNLLETARNIFLDGIGFNTNTYMSAEDKDNAARGETADKVSAELQGLRDSGLLNDDIMRILPEKVQKVMASGKPLKENELKDVKEALVKGVGTSLDPDSDSPYRERGQYDQDLAALQIKKELIESDPRHKPSDLNDIRVQIKRSQVLRNNNIPYEDLKLYQTVGNDEWKKMGIPPGAKNHDPDIYDPELYQRLWEIDEMFTKSGGSYGKKPDKQKYTASKSGSGGSGSGRSGGSVNFGRLQDSVNVPKAREYRDISVSSLPNIPLIKVQRPKINHKIKVQ